MSAKKKEAVRSYEESVAELENILERLSAEDVTLEESIELYAKATEQIVFCDKTLKEAQLRIETIDQALAAALDGEENADA